MTLTRLSSERAQMLSLLLAMLVRKHLRFTPKRRGNHQKVHRIVYLFAKSITPNTTFNIAPFSVSFQWRVPSSSDSISQRCLATAIRSATLKTNDVQVTRALRYSNIYRRFNLPHNAVVAIFIAVFIGLLFIVCCSGCRRKKVDGSVWFIMLVMEVTCRFKAATIRLDVNHLGWTLITLRIGGGSYAYLIATFLGFPFHCSIKPQIHLPNTFPTLEDLKWVTYYISSFSLK